MRPELNQVVTRCLEDSAYLGRFLANPAGAAGELGIALTGDDLAQISRRRAEGSSVVAGRFGCNYNWYTHECDPDNC